MRERGRVLGGAVVLRRPIDLPDGTEVLVQIEAVAAPAAAPNGRRGAASQGDRAPSRVRSGPAEAPNFYGLWAGRDEMEDGAAWVRSQRATWSRRTNRERSPA